VTVSIAILKLILRSNDKTGKIKCTFTKFFQKNPEHLSRSEGSYDVKAMNVLQANLEVLRAVTRETPVVWDLMLSR
jgi:hypothetical protein